VPSELQTFWVQASPSSQQFAARLQLNVCVQMCSAVQSSAVQASSSLHSASLQQPSAGMQISCGQHFGVSPWQHTEPSVVSQHGVAQHPSPQQYGWSTGQHSCVASHQVRVFGQQSSSPKHLP
jgi:hypothetical protein